MRERAIEARKKAIRDHEEYLRMVKENEVRYERETLVRRLQAALGVQPDEVQIARVSDRPPYWEASVDGLTFRVDNHELQVAWRCVNHSSGCQSVVWYEVSCLEALGSLLMDERNLLPCEACSEREREQAEKAAREVPEPPAREEEELHICPLMSKFCTRESCAWWDDWCESCCVISIAVAFYEIKSALAGARPQ